MICPPCALAADVQPEGHPATTCRDHAIPGHGCTCQHNTVRDEPENEGP